MRLGISSYTYTWAVGVAGYENTRPMTPFSLIDKAVEHGIGIVQIADNLPLEFLADEELEQIRAYSASKKISIEMGSRGLTGEHTIRCLNTAEKIGSHILRMVIDGKNFEPDLQTVSEIIHGLLPELQRRNIKLAIENHDRFKAIEFKEMILSANSEFIGICLDSVNSMGAGEGFETVSDILIPYTINLHLKDFDIFRMPHKMGIIIEGRPAGKGRLDIQNLINRIEATGNCRSAILELWTPPEDNIADTIKKEAEWADTSISFLKNFLY